MILPPGTLLQHMYLKERLKLRPPGRFIEVGVGQGVLSKLLLDAGWSGEGYELNPHSIANATALNQEHIRNERYRLHNKDWLETKCVEHVDLIISSMVLEHLDDK